MLIGVIAIAAALATRVHLKRSKAEMDWAGAQRNAASAIEGGCYMVDNYPDWREGPVMPGFYTVAFVIGNGQASVTLVDPIDGDVANSPSDDLLIVGTGMHGSSQHQTTVLLQAINQPLDALNTALHAGGNIQVASGTTVTVQNAPLSTNDNVDVDGFVTGDVEADTQSGFGFIFGEVTLGGDPKDAPDSAVVDDYVSLATVISPPGSTIEKFVLSPAVNPWGATNANGVYAINTNGGDLTIQGCRIWGTLIVRTNGGTVTLDEAVLMESFRSDYPVLIVDGDLIIKTSGQQLSEATWSTNFNPTGSPYQNNNDADQADTYPNEIVGLVHVTGSFEAQQAPMIRGVVLCEGNALFSSGNTAIEGDTSIYTDPPEGYSRWIMQISPGSWAQSIDY